MHHVIRSLKFTCFQLSNNFFKLSSNVPYQYTIEKISHWACLEDRMGQTYPHLCLYWHWSRSHFIGSRYILLQLEARVLKVTLKKNLISRKSRAYGTVWYIIYVKITLIWTTSTQLVRERFLLFSFFFFFRSNYFFKEAPCGFFLMFKRALA